MHGAILASQGIDRTGHIQKEYPEHFLKQNSMRINLVKYAGYMKSAKADEEIDKVVSELNQAKDIINKLWAYANVLPTLSSYEKNQVLRNLEMTGNGCFNFKTVSLDGHF
jgi:hypothetical protein